MRVFLTGSSGFIGKHIREALEEAGHTVTLHSYSQSGILEEIPENTDIAVNSAGRLGGQGYTEDDLRKANFLLPVKMAGICRQRNIPLIHLSTPGVCGLRAGGRETDEYAPADLYERTKAQAELWLLENHPGVTILRPDFVFGAGDMHKYPLFRQVSKGWFPLVGRGGAKTRPTDARDVSRAVIEALPGGPLHGGVFNIAGSDILSVRETAITIADALGMKVKTIPIPRIILRIALKLGPLCPDALSESRYRLFGTDRYTDTGAASEAGFEPRYRFRQTAEEAVKWYRDRGLL